MKTHENNRREAAEAAKNAPKKDFDPIFDEPEEYQDEQIRDDTENIKQITGYLKKAANILNFTANKYYPIDIAQNYQKFPIPETFRDIIKAFSDLSLTNAQEFAVQLAVQTKKSNAIISKLAKGVCDKFAIIDRSLNSSLGAYYTQTQPDFRWYLKIRSDLYKAISQKYMSHSAKDEELCMVQISKNKTKQNKTKKYI